MSRIVIFGATPGIGRAAVDEALVRGHEVRAFARSADSIDLEHERLIRQSELDWTIVRPAKLTNGPRTERYDVLREPGDFRFGTISRRDVAHFLIDEVEGRKAVHEAPVLAA